MNKKGFIFILSSILLVIILLVVFLTFDQYTFSDATVADQRRVNFANDFVKGFNQDLERAIRIASFRSLIALEEHVALSGSFLNNTEDYFSEIVYNGSINGVPSKLMENSSILVYLERINIIGDRFGLEVDVVVDDISLSQSDPWLVDVVVAANVSVQDKSNLVSWHFSNDYKSEVPIENLRDPLYAVFTQNRFYNTVRPFPSNLSEGDSATNMESLVGSSYYVESESAPSFIQRFSNNLTPSSAGIESVVNILLISDQNVPVYENRVKVDYIYFNNLESDSVCFEEISAEYYFIIPSNRVSLYEIDDLSSTTSCPIVG